MIIVLLWLNHSNAIAQKSCLQSLEKAEMLYTEGKLNLIPDLLTNCIKKGFDYEQKVRAYELVILSYLYLDNEKDAANSMLDLLKFEKEYTLTGREPTEFKKLYEAFRTYPIVMIGINLGGNASLITHNELYGVNNPSADSISYSLEPGFKVGITSDFQIGKHILFSSEINILSLSYSYTNHLYDFTQYDLREKQTVLSFPLGVKLMAGNKKIRPYITLGTSLDILLKANLNIIRTFPNQPVIDVTGQDVDVTNLRNEFNYHIYAGAGFKLKVPRSFLFFEAKFSKSQLNQVNENNRYGNAELIYKYGHIDNDFFINYLSISAGIQYNIYKPKILKKYFYH
ncbi:outer membrane beta-barrel protein [Chondrinema litorale]|uniref:outer membrane beta-barrel protein n=1 Tax=Chondrinema litorale TaxID=2994555 RepID=UPI002542CFDC|nr:outer membrane beta-barrel protein [Chondrinema litorale]UZR95876.1 outer membrane beta-barrel protein [Chondrinema litorale]